MQTSACSQFSNQFELSISGNVRLSPSASNFIHCIQHSHAVQLCPSLWQVSVLLSSLPFAQTFPAPKSQQNDPRFRLVQSSKKIRQRKPPMVSNLTKDYSAFLTNITAVFALIRLVSSASTDWISAVSALEKSQLPSVLSRYASSSARHCLGLH